MILYNCPDIQMKSSGINRIYRHVEFLIDSGFDAAVLHSKSGFERKDKLGVPVHYLDKEGDLQEGDVVIIPEVAPDIMKQLALAPVRKMVFALSWVYAFGTLPIDEDYNDYGIERLLVSCPFIGDMVGWSMSLPAHLVENSIDPEIYYPEFDLADKKKKIVFLERKGELIPSLLRVLKAKNKKFVSEIEWFALGSLEEGEYAAHIREAAIFVNVSLAEGILNASFQAMRCNTLLAGFDSIGGQGSIVSEGEDQNYIVAQTGDFLSLAWLMEPLLEDLLKGDLSEWQKQADNAYKFASSMTIEKERESVVSLWNRLSPENKKTS
ncbi:MAG: hypothetical protein NE334_03250 [Lentisphaeraceae bacterium]|nr:hypothetical protein [Lentisphaeraceae bacterium]